YPNFLPFFLFLKAKYRLGYPTGGFGFLLDETTPWQEGLHETEHMLRLLKPVVKDIRREPLDLDYLTDEIGASKLLQEAFPNRPGDYAVIHPFCQSSFLKDQKQWQTEEWRKIIMFLESN